MKKLKFYFNCGLFYKIYINFIRSLLDYRYVFGHYLVSYIYVCLYIQIAIKLLGFSVQEFAMQASDVSSTWYFFKYDLFSEFYSEAFNYFYRVELHSVSDSLALIIDLDFFPNYSVTLFPYFMSFTTVF